MNVSFRLFLFLLLLLPVVSRAQKFPLTDQKNGLQILYSPAGPKLDSIAAHLLANDLKMVTGNQPPVITDWVNATGNVIVIGHIASPLIQQLIGSHELEDLRGKWECYGYRLIDHPRSNIAKVLVIAGSDTRGTAYGVFSISQEMGVTPWYWWADATVQQQKELTLELPTNISRPPSVKYRGLFINDEDWGLQPWAAKTFEPETGDIGPKTYAKVFELLLRLKANLIWPAMHPCTKAFFSYPGNKKVAEEYGMVIGSSHAEPMLRNNVGEWDEKTMGAFNYSTNKEKVFSYWESRVKETVANDAIYTMGMRGVHDSGMEGIKNAKEAVPLLEQIIKDQRGLLEKYRGKKANSIPQAFTAYKEVLDIYDNGLKIPEDITLVWPDDNYGYIQRLSNAAEQKRAGGSGVYYHASYWGRPHDYLWLSATQPALMHEEMSKAWEQGARNLWVLNVGDIKPLEYTISLFLQMAWNMKNYRENSLSVIADHHYWLIAIFGEELAGEIGAVLRKNDQLAFERRPEFMGWSRTEPTTQTTTTQYNHFFYGDEAQQRIDQYEKLEMEVKALRLKIKDSVAAAFYQLVYYPVLSASWMNKKFLYRDKAIFYAKQHRLSAKDYASQSKAMYDSIVKETTYYNNVLSDGKWKNIMSMKPRDLPVYQEPVLPEIIIDGTAVWGIAPEGFDTKDGDGMALAAFDNLNQQSYFIDVFLNDNQPVNWTAVPSHTWIQLSKRSGSLEAGWGKNQVRIWVTIDWKRAPKDNFSGSIVFNGNGKQLKVAIEKRQLKKPAVISYYTFIENNGFVSMYANHFTRQLKKMGYSWVLKNELGYSGNVLQAGPISEKDTMVSTDTASIKNNNSFIEYQFNTYTAAPATIHVYSLPTHPVNNTFRMRYGVSVDAGPLTIVDFKTEGRSEEWKQNVLSNRAERTIPVAFLNTGQHTLKIYCMDPGVLLDEIRIDLGGLKKAYSALRETTLKK